MTEEILTKMKESLQKVEDNMQEILDTYEEALQYMSTVTEGWNSLPEGIQKYMTDQLLESVLVKVGYRFRGMGVLESISHTGEFTDFLNRMKVVFTQVKIANKNRPQSAE